VCKEREREKKKSERVTQYTQYTQCIDICISVHYMCMCAFTTHVHVHIEGLLRLARDGDGACIP
jgi:hypothetical protein